MPQKLQSHPALAIIDMQNGFCHPSGSFGKSGLPTTNHMAIVPTINRLKALCRDRGIPIIYTQMAWNEDYSDAGLLADTIPDLKANKGLIRGTWDVEILDDLKPQPNDLIITKTRNTAFWRTEFEQILRERGINQIIATGVGTDVCVESTVRDAWTNGFYALTVTDATATLTREEHEASLLSMKYFGGTISAKELEAELQEWKSADLE